jgi:hypothetical protein
MKNRKSKTMVLAISLVTAMFLISLTTFCDLFDTSMAEQVYAEYADKDFGNTLLAQAINQIDASATNLTPEQRLELLERTLDSIRITSEKAEGRSYYNKMVSHELMSYMRVIAIILLFIAIGFPLTLWLLSRKRLIGLTGLPSEVTGTLIMIEERQAKLANILKEIQGEIDYLHTMSVPDLKNLIQQAEAYLKQNEQDLKDAGLKKDDKKTSK